MNYLIRFLGMSLPSPTYGIPPNCPSHNGIDLFITNVLMKNDMKITLGICKIGRVYAQTDRNVIAITITKIRTKYCFSFL